jgi:hypothetical protein
LIALMSAGSGNQRPSGVPSRIRFARAHPGARHQAPVGRAALRCAFPDCRKVLSRTPNEERPDYPLGEQAHIVSHASGGVRDDGSVPDDERDRYGNSILLRRDDHAVIDHEPGGYTIARLREMKEAARALGR